MTTQTRKRAQQPARRPDAKERMLRAATQVAATARRHPEHKRPTDETVECQDVRYTAQDGEAVAYRKARAYLFSTSVDPR